MVAGEVAIDHHYHRRCRWWAVIVGVTVTVTVTVRNWVTRVTRHYFVPARPAWEVAGP